MMTGCGTKLPISSLNIVNKECWFGTHFARNVDFGPPQYSRMVFIRRQSYFLQIPFFKEATIMRAILFFIDPISFRWVLGSDCSIANRAWCSHYINALMCRIRQYNFNLSPLRDLITTCKTYIELAVFHKNHLYMYLIYIQDISFFITLTYQYITNITSHTLHFFCIHIFQKSPCFCKIKCGLV